MITWAMVTTLRRPPWTRGLALAALLGVCLPGLARAASPIRNYVVIVANNRSLTPGVEPLHYADDDGARWHELLAPLAERISLFAVLDQESQRLFRGVAALAQAPTRAAVLERLAEYNREMEAARAAGLEPVLYLVLVGHGEVGAGGEGFISLLDAPLSRGDLFRQVIAPSRASYNHIVVDACNAYLMVARRGDAAGDDRGPSAAGAIRRYLSDEDLARHPATGVILSTSRARATHEWSVYRGGVFSHQVRSALTGAADVNGDGRIEYSEVRAYVAAANLRVDDPRARLDIYVHPPALDRARPLVDLGGAAYRNYLRLGASVEGRYHLEDGRGVRYADFHKSAERPLVLALVDAAEYYLRTETAEVRLRLGRPGAIEVRPEQLVPRALAARGSIEESFRRHLFEVPYGPSFYSGYVASTGETPVASSSPPFQPPSAEVDTTGLRRRREAARARAARLGLVEGDDALVDLLLQWSAARLSQGDLREAERAVSTLERRMADVAIDRALVARKLQRARALANAPGAAPPLREAAREVLGETGKLLERGDLQAANRGLNALLGTLGTPAQPL